MLFGRLSVLSMLMALAVSMASAASAPPEQAQPAAATAALWKTVAASGDVATQAASSAPQHWVQLRRGDQVAPLSHVRTQAKANATLTRDGDVILVAPGSDVVLPEPSVDGMTRVQQRTGKAFYQVSPRSSGRFEVQTPMLVAGVKGTQFSVAIEEGRAAVSVVEGHVEVRSLLTGERQDLYAGQSAVVDSREQKMQMHREEPGKTPKRGRENASELPAILEETTRLNESVEKDATVAADMGRSLWDDLGLGAPSHDPSRNETGKPAGDADQGGGSVGDVGGTVGGVVGTVGGVVGGVVGTDPAAPPPGTSPITPVIPLLNGLLRRP